VHPFEDELSTDEGWAKYNVHYWRRDFAGFARVFFGEIFVEAHSSKQIDDGVGWAMETDPETLIATARAPYLVDDPPADRPVAAQVSCPSLVIHGDRDGIVGSAAGPVLADALGCPIEVFAGGGHCVQARHPVRFNLALPAVVSAVRGR